MVSKNQVHQRVSPYVKHIAKGKKDKKLLKLYPEYDLPRQQKRYCECVRSLYEHYGDRIPASADVCFFSAPGRTEIIGNHTDHNLGKVLGASVNLDVIAAAVLISDPEVRVKSKGHGEIVVNLNDMDSFIAGDDMGSSVSLVRGILAGFQKRGYKIRGQQGFVAATMSDIPTGSGLSSSAAFEVLIATIVSSLMLETHVSPTVVAQIAQEAEEHFYGKPCGLLDQTTSAVGSCVAIDFLNPKIPRIKRVNMDLASFGTHGYSLCIVNTGGDHADLTDEYAAIRKEMVQVANEQIKENLTISEYSAVKKRGAFDPDVLRYMSESGFRKSIPNLHAKGLVGDRAILRAIHFYEENDRVEQLIKAIRNGDLQLFLETIIKSGQSSYMYNQNIFPLANPNHQPVALGLAMSEELLRNCGAWRVHGGGFAGTIQAFVPTERVAPFKKRMNATFGKNATYVLQVRKYGGIKLF